MKKENQPSIKNCNWGQRWVWNQEAALATMVAVASWNVAWVECIMKEALTNFAHRLGQAYWIEVKTGQPRCTYYFGPYLAAKEAEAEINGYIDDLKSEGAQNITASVKRCKPTALTITDDTEHTRNGYGH